MEEHPITVCPPGFARGCFELRDRGLSIIYEITCWPKDRPMILWDCQFDELQPVIRVAGARMWAQELYVYRQERTHSIGAMLEELGSKGMLPRPIGLENEVQPLAGDFGMTWGPWQCQRCLKEWERVKGEAPREFCPSCNAANWQYVETPGQRKRELRVQQALQAQELSERLQREAMEHLLEELEK